MLKRIIDSTQKLTVFVASVIALTACVSEQEFFESQRSAIVGGEKDTSEAHGGVAALYLKAPPADIWRKVRVESQKDGDMPTLGASCTGTLINADTVVTAGHCVNHIIKYRLDDYLKVWFTNNANNPEPPEGSIFDIKRIYLHPHFKMDGSMPVHDVAILRLVEKVPETIAKPIPLLPAEHAMTSKRLLAKNRRYPASVVGFGDNGRGAVNVKRITSDAFSVYAFCSEKPIADDICQISVHTLFDNLDIPYNPSFIADEMLTVSPNGLLYANKITGACSGDSGGPLFVTISDGDNGREYLAAVTSYGDEDCKIYGVSTALWPYAVFFRNVLERDRCENGFDDDKDGRIDCQDTECAEFPICKAGKEICENGIDDNGNGKTDCDDPDCESRPDCPKKEICNDGKDNNGDGKMDCDDPECKKFSECMTQFEVCDDGQDNDGDGKIDCDDDECASFATCKIENCTDKKDNDGDGKIDCDDSDCLQKAVCKTAEICDDGKDNDGNGKIDGDDKACKKSEKSSSCSVNVMRHADKKPFFTLFFLSALLLRRRKFVNRSM